MPSFQSIVLTDRTLPTAISRTFTPYSKKDGVAVLSWSPDGTLASAHKLSVSKRPVNGKVKTRILLAVPVTQTETILGIANPKVVREFYIDCTITASAFSTEQERADAIGMFMSALDKNQVLINNTVVKNEEIW